jgi:hypothetical protein
MPDIIAELRQPLIRSPAPPDTIRLGLVLNGTVSAGAWTAGVLDGLFEALDAWEAARAEGRDVPRHRVRLEMLGGASGGAVCAALAARAATRDFAPVHGAGGRAGNPFWEVWVERLRIEDMLRRDDLAGEAPAESILSGAAISAAVDTILSWQGTPRAAPRGWLADPFHVGVTQTNLRGVPYEITFRPSGPGDAPRTSQFVSHADHALFAFPLVAREPGQGVRGDQWEVPPASGDTREAWRGFADHARASGAFPGGFPPMRLSRPRAHYDWRAVMLPAGGGQPAEPRLLVPVWPPDLDPLHYEYFAMDGGAINNGPLDLVRSGMAGLGKTLERSAEEADAAVVVLDPFAARSSIAPPGAHLPLLSGLGALAGALVANGRFATADLLLALDPDVRSRYLLTAGRDREGGAGKSWGEDALTTAGLSAFLGFFDRRLRVHDFLLGRANVLRWLAQHFTLPADNAVFRHAGKGGEDFAARSGERPIVPVMPEVAVTGAQPPWPDLHPLLDTRKDDFQERLQAVLAHLLAGVPCEGLLAQLAGNWAGSFIAGKVGAAARDLPRRR